MPTKRKPIDRRLNSLAKNKATSVTDSTMAEASKKGAMVSSEKEDITRKDDSESTQKHAQEGSALDISNHSKDADSSDDDVPLSKLSQKLKTSKTKASFNQYST